MIKKLRMSTNANMIQVAKDCAPGCSYRNIFIEGTLESYCLAKKMIYDIINEVMDMQNNKQKRIATFTLNHTMSSDPYVEVIVPNAYIGLVLGPEMATLNQIHETTGAQILVPTTSAPGTNNRYITLTGNPDSIRRAKRAIYEILEPAYRRHAVANGIPPLQDHEQIDPDFPYCSFYAMILKQQMITMSACESAANTSMGYWTEYTKQVGSVGETQPRREELRPPGL